MIVGTLERENFAAIHVPAWTDVETALNEIDPAHSGFVILIRHDGSYVQVAGSKLELTVEWRQVTGPYRFKHCVIGRPTGPNELTSINTSSGIIQLHRNEILTLKDAIELFKYYYGTGLVSDAWSLRDCTAMFTEL